MYLAGLSPNDLFQTLQSKGQEHWQTPGWKTRKSSGRIAAERLVIPQFPHHFIRTSYEIHCPIAKAAAYIVLDKDAQAKWDSTIDRVRVIEKDGPWAIFQAPIFTGAHPILQNREIIYFEGYQWTESGDFLSAACSVDLPQIPHLPKTKPAKLLLVYRNLYKTGENSCRFEYLVQTDMNWWLPAGLTSGGTEKSMLVEGQKWITHLER